ncbi:fatty acid-binding protein-like [Saccoglossus kowalevskii]|uniref:Fatty acid-binding protein, epidermal-like n=1 Tax=Saccoglossus kowalevskii TaxID=10224 RepID=A0ABM0MQ53_SACKO|nr:PREDICTED: fatty acid-binding protein, epidermal-like [Saccoglossus kowalevskii]
MAASIDFSGSWKLSRSENFEEYLNGMGVGIIMRKAATIMTPTCKIIQNGDEMEIKMCVPMTTLVQKFRIGEPFQDTSPSGEIKTMIAKWEDGKLVFNESEEKEVHHSVIREIIDDEMVMTCIVGDITCKRIFKRI